MLLSRTRHASKELIKIFREQAQIAGEQDKLVQAGVEKDPLDIVEFEAPTTKRVSRKPITGRKIRRWRASLPR